jgi:hypothetical protein
MDFISKETRCLSIGLAILLLSVVSCNSEGSSAGVLSDVELVNIRDDLELWSYLKAGQSFDEGAQKMLASSILRKLFIVRSENASIELINGRALETLCMLMEPNTKEILKKSNQPKLVKIAVDYLDSVENQTRNKIKKVQQTLKGTGCYLTPQ